MNDDDDKPCSMWDLPWVLASTLALFVSAILTAPIGLLALIFCEKEEEE